MKITPELAAGLGEILEPGFEEIKEQLRKEIAMSDPNPDQATVEFDAVDDLISAPAKAMSEQRKMGMMMILNAMVTKYADKIKTSAMPHMLRGPKLEAYRDGAKDMFEVLYRHMEDTLDNEEQIR